MRSLWAVAAEIAVAAIPAVITLVDNERERRHDRRERELDRFNELEAARIGAEPRKEEPDAGPENTD